MTEPAISPTTCIVRRTADRKGRTTSVSPGATAARHLHYGRIILDAGEAPLLFSTAGQEAGLIGMRGSASVLVDGHAYTLGRYDSLYVPRETEVEVTPGSEGCDLTELGARVSARYPVQFVSFEAVQRDPGLSFKTGGPSARRHLNILLGKNVQAGRIMAGVTFSEAGNWTSWPPHEHAAMLEEAYLYVEMPPPGFGLQLVFTDTDVPELATFVRQDDVVLMPTGYHPNVAAPGGSINFIWMMAANREDVDRQFGVVNVLPAFASGGSGIDQGRADRK
jgi:5-deoxy-glucuronate isomerase